MTSPLRWHWSSPTCTHASRSHTSPGQCPLASAEPLLPLLCMATPQLWYFQVLALVYHQNLRGGPGPEGLGTAAAAPCKPHCTAEAPRPGAGPAAVPAPEQGGAAGKQWGDLKARVGTKLWPLMPCGCPTGRCHPESAAGSVPWPGTL